MGERERRSIQEELSPPFDVYEPAELTSPFVFSSPHSGRVYPASFLEDAQLDPMTLRKSEDCFVDELYADVVDLGAPLIAARFPRAYLDVNREPFELDPVLFKERLPEYANTQSVRVIGGLGTIARIVTEKEEIYDKPLKLPAALARIDQLYRPYHATLTRMLNTARARFGYAVLIDCHSMPSASSATLDNGRPDIVLGDRFGTACHPSITQIAEAGFRDLGYHVSLNRPYAGGFITEHYGQPNNQIHALQIELNRGLYLDEDLLRKTCGFHDLAEHLKIALSWVMNELPSDILPAAAAE